MQEVKAGVIVKERNNSVGINFSFPLRWGNSNTFSVNKTTLDALKENIKILLLTKKGERVVNPDIGTNIPMLSGELFEQINKVEMQTRMTSEISSAFKQWIKNANFAGLEIFTQEDDSLKKNDVRVKIFYQLAKGGINDNITLRISGS